MIMLLPRIFGRIRPWYDLWNLVKRQGFKPERKFHLDYTTVLAKAFHSLGRIGDDLFIEPHKDHMAFRTVNMAESAYASFTFSKSFFSSFTFSEEENEETLRCKIAMKSLLVVLKSQHGERLMEWCQIQLDPNGTKVVFQLRYSYGCTKTHFLPILESETLQANYCKEDSQNQLSAMPKLLSTAVKNFRISEYEVTLCVTIQKIILKNHIENNLDSKKTVKTEICLYPGEFESYNIGAPSSVTFCLKELKAVLFFAEYTGLPVQLYVSDAGKPVVFVVNNDTVYEANYVVSTLNETGASHPLSQTSQSSVATNSRTDVPPNSKKRSYQEMNETGQIKSAVAVTPQVGLLGSPIVSPHLSTEPVILEKSANCDNIPELGILNNSDLHGATAQSIQFANETRDSNVTQPVVRSVFGRCFNTTFKKQSVPGFDKVFAYDSDGMEDSD